MGRGVSNPNDSWVAQLPARIERYVGPVEIAHRTFFPNGAGALAHLERTLAKDRPELVIAHSGTWIFTAFDVSYAIRDHFGKRAQAIFDTTESGFRAIVRRSGRPGTATDAAAKGLARRLLGRAPLLTEEVVTETWLAAFDRLAREEDVQTLVEAPFVPAPGFQTFYPGAAAARERFAATLRERAEQHHFRWVDAEPAVAAMPGGVEACVTADLVHRNELGHRLALDAIAAAILEDFPAAAMGQHSRAARPLA